MNDMNPATPRVVYVASLVAILGAVIVLIDGFIQPFNGTAVGFAGRMLGAVGIMVFSLSNLWRGRGRVTVLMVGLVVGIAGVILVVAGRIR
jgi:hypothetical protein